MSRKYVVIKDVHGSTYWKDILKVEGKDSFLVFVGDYFDHFTISGDVQEKNAREIFEWVAMNEGICLLGNHDIPYLNASKSISGYQPHMYPSFNQLLTTYDFSIAFVIGDWLITHAGVSRVWCELFDIPTNDINELAAAINEHWKYRQGDFDFLPATPRDTYGTSTTQGPLWIRPSSLVHCTVPYNQIFGHTNGRLIRKEYVDGKLLMCIDAPHKYVVIQNNKWEIKEI